MAPEVGQLTRGALREDRGVLFRGEDKTVWEFTSCLATVNRALLEIRGTFTAIRDVLESTETVQEKGSAYHRIMRDQVLVYLAERGENDAQRFLDLLEIPLGQGHPCPKPISREVDAAPSTPAKRKRKPAGRSKRSARAR